MPRRKMLEPRCVSTSTKLSEMEHQQFMRRCDEDNVVPSQLLRHLVCSYSVGGVSVSELESLQVRHWLAQAPSHVRDSLTKTPNLEGEQDYASTKKS